ncbi:hypothetical protein WJX82_008148 [Trebouxia sp. C0006]
MNHRSAHLKNRRALFVSNEHRYGSKWCKPVVVSLGRRVDEIVSTVAGPRSAIRLPATACAAALEQILEVAPHFERIMLPYFTGSQTALQQLWQLDEPEQAILMARAVWRSLQLLPALRTSWSCSLLYSIMLHKVPEVRWYAVHCVAIMTKLDDDSRQQLLLHVLTKAEQMECFMQERKRSLSVKVQQAAMPLLLEGPPGCGKTALVEELAQLTGNVDMVRVHVDDQMDSKSLLGAYVCTSNPEEFVWQPGPLTQAVAQGKWLVIEDLNLAPPEVLAALVPLLGSRQLHLPQRAQLINAAPGFQLLASITTAPGAGSAGAYGSSQAVKEVLGSLLSAVTVAPPTDQEQLLIMQGRFPDLACLLPCAMAVLHLVRRAAGQLIQQQSISEEGGVEWVVSSALAAGGVKHGDVGLHVGRHYSIRDLITWCNRMQGIHGQLLMRSLRRVQSVEYSLDASALPITVREAAFVEAADCFAALIAKPEARMSLLRALAAVWQVGEEQVQLYTALRKPSLHTSQTEATIGRATLPVLSIHSKQPGLTSAPNSNKGSGSNFAQTGHAMRLLEGVGVALQQQEPALLVGETGTGKTTLVQRLADQVGAKLVVLNLSQQTDSSDLVGGFKPVEPRDALLPLLDTFQRLVRLTWSKGNNEDFLGRVTKYAQRQKWSSLLKAFQTAVQKVQKMHEAQETSASVTEERSAKRRKTSPEVPAAKKKPAVSKSTWEAWQRFGSDVSAAEKASMMAEKDFAFAFVEGALVKAVREGWWLLLDEINLAPAEALERIAGLLEGSSGSVTIAERGDMVGVPRHPNFRLLAAMNPATDAGKRDLPAPLRNRFTEIWVAEPAGREDLCTLVLAYLQGTVPHPPVDNTVNFYQAAKTAADSGRLQDGAHQKPSYSLRTLCRALEYCQTALPLYGMQRALLDGLKMAFMTQLDPECAHIIRNLINVHVTGSAKPLKTLERAPAAPSGSGHVLFEQFWLEKGPGPAPEAATTDGQGGHFVMTGSVKSHLHNLARAALIGRYPILLQGPTSSGKTSLVAYLAAQTGHKLVRINNHEQTDLQEYLGSYISNETGQLVFREGALVQAVRQGHWLLLDELNLAPSQILEALNRLLDDNRQLFVPELQETINPHPHFMLFATQNPPGQYGGRKVLSRAFRSRFLELHVGDLPDDELEFILQQRCALAPSYSKKLVGVMRDLYRTRQVSNVFAGKHGFITPRDLFKWAGRGAVGYPELAENGYLLLGERLRTPEDRAIVHHVLEKQMKVQLDLEGLYDREGSAPLQHLQAALTDEKKKASAHASGDSLTGVVWTPSMRRMYTLLDRCVQHSEPALLVGDTGTGKTTVCQMLTLMRGQKLHIINCNQHTETSDFLGGFRPVRDRERSVAAFHAALQELQRSSLLPQCNIHVTAADDLAGSDLMNVATDAVTAVGMIEKYMEVNASGHSWQAEHKRLRQLVGSMVEAAASARAPFEWADGPLVTAMRQGDIILIDELNLAEDAVLERLNSVLEPGRTLTLAEKGGAGAEVITAAPGFRLVGTMNPGGDYGKKELSPALSNRFTQIWVPSIEDQAELAAIIQSRITDPAVRQAIADKLLDFWTFYKAHAGAARTGLSVRDLLAWVRFINAAAPHIGTEAAYAHGAHLVLLDGIGLGVGMPLQVAQALREKCQRYLAGQLPNNQADVAQAAGVVPASNEPTVSPTNDMQVDNDSQGAGQNNVVDGLWGIPPFFVERGPQPTPPNPAPFDFRAPTTASNALRVLRALQLKKAVLLEGSPGVGKTSLVAALAAAIGQKLVRINLSEQTDMMDLLGADLPVEGGAPGQFAWCDGPLLAAIKAGHWVLLDELNLAGQSVLEGLNAVLDHRAEVFIPELGQTFQCPPSFHLFAAQNPLQEGGGRKGLPKSFLNRFSRVHIQLLLSQDLLFIAGSLHPSIPADCLANMVSFLKALHEGANTQRSFASAGGPWEFNLRDLLRWCDLAEAAVPAHESSAALAIEAAVEHFSQMLFFERLRTPQDRQHLLQLYQQCWGHPLPLTPTPELTICPAFVKLGWATLPRTLPHADSMQHAADSGIATAPYIPAKASPSTEPGQCLQLLPSQQAELESVLQGVAMGWMCILVGGPGVGKTSLARTAAQLANRKLTEIALTGGTDTADLLGGFEQLEPKRRVQELAEDVQGLVDAATHQVLTAGTALPLLLPERLPLLASMADAWTAYATLAAEDSAPSSSPDTGLEQEVRLLMTVVQQVQAVVDACRPHLQWAHQAQQLQQKLQGLQAAVASAEAGAGRFEWVDGALTQAVEAGEWVLLDSANLCNPTVLDRLNPMLEPGGQLYLNECGTVNGQPRVIQPHPGFRLFLALDPRNGEHATKAHRRPPGVHELRHLASLTHTLLDRGWGLQEALSTAWDQVYIRSENSPELKNAARKALQHHCTYLLSPNSLDESDIMQVEPSPESRHEDPDPNPTNATTPAQQLSLVKPSGGISSPPSRSFDELASESDRDLRSRWSQSLASQMKEALSGLGPKLDTVVTAAQSVAEAVQQLMGHPVALQLLQAVQASQGAKAALQQGLITAAVLAAPSAGSQPSPRSILQESHWRHTHPLMKARMNPVHPAVDWLYLCMAATAAVEKACLQSSSALIWTSELHNQVAALQQWRGTMWAYAHGSLTPEADPTCQGFAVEPITFTWTRLTQTISKLTATNPELLQWPEVVHLQQIAQQMNQHLGLAAGLPPRPLMWRDAGHPAQPASLRLCAMQADLFQLLNLTRPGTGKGFQLDKPSALKLQQLVLTLDQNHLQGSLGPALVATLSADVQLRQTLLQGACFFTLAAGKAKHSKGLDTHPDRAEQHRRQLEGQEEQAEGILALVEGSVRKVVEQAAERGGGSEENSNSLTLPDCRALGTNPAMGHLPELLPAVLMSHQAFQQLQLQLLPFQEVESLQNGITLMAQLTAWLVSLTSTDALTAVRPPAALVGELRASVQAAVRSGAQGVLHSMPHQLLLWLLEAQHEDVDELSMQAASLVHEAWYSWHQALWHNRLAHAVPANGPLLLQGATRSRLAADVVFASATPILHHQAKALQLQLLVRHMARSSVQQASEAGAEGNSARAEWRSLAGLLAQAILAHLPSIPDQVMQHRIAAVVKQLLLLPSAGKANDRPADLTTELIQLLHSSSHSTLKQLLQPLLLPCLDAIVLTDDVLPETEVRQQLQRLPGAPTQSSHLAALRSTAAELRQKAADMEAKAVPRPIPPQYTPLWQNVQRFLVGLGSVERMMSLLIRLTQGDASAAQEAEVFQQNAASWSDALLQQHPLYRDVLQPVGLAVYEVRCGLSLMAHAAAKKADQELANSTLADCMAFPSSLGQGAMCGSEPAEQLLSALARRGNSGQHKSDRAGDVAAYGARLHALRAALHAAVRSALVEGPTGGAAAQSEQLFRRLLTAWEEVKSAEEQRAAEEAEMFKTKTRKIASEEEVDELSYKQSFPDHFSAFADVAQLEDMPDLGDDSSMLQQAAAEEAESGVTDAQASSIAAQQLLHGDILVDVVSLHARLYTTFTSATHHTQDEDDTWQAAFKLSYELGCSVLHGTQALPPVHIDHVTSGSHLMRLTMQHQELVAAPTPVAGQGDAVDIQKACVEEAALLAGPVCGLKARMEQLLLEWPEHPVLVQLSAICDRLTGLSVQSPLKAALTGLELLLARAQVWEESAAKHVSLAKQLEAVAALATRWRKLELAAWRNLLNTTRSRHAAGAHCTWFHLYRLVLEQPPEVHAEEEERQQIQQVAAAVEQFLQTSTVGEYEQRLNMVWSFRCHALVQSQVHSKNPQRWTAIAAALYNTHRYYKQFLALMQKAIADGLAELEKQLEDFVRLAKWEDRGYYAMKATTEHLTDALDKAALGAAKGGQAGKSASGSKRKHAQSVTLEEVQQENIRAWQSFCSTSLKVTPSDVASGPAYCQGLQAGQSQQGDLYQHRLPQLGTRMQQLLVEAAVAWVASTEGAMGIEEVAGEAAERALELRQVTDKGARLRKKKALNDLLKALGALGLTRRRAAVPPHDRTVHAWFTQISPQLEESPVLSSEAALIGVAAISPQLEESPVLSSEAALTGVASVTLEAAHQQWSKADAYYYMGIARMQRLWEAAKTPHHDMSALEVESSVRFSEHLLFVQRSQRHTLSTLSQQFKQLQALCQVLTSFKHGSLAPQAGVPQRMQDQVAQLDRLHWLLADTTRLVSAVGRVEGNAAAKSTLQGTAKVLQQHQGWKQALLALQEAALQSSELGQAGEGTRSQEAAVTDSPDEERLGQQWQEEVEAVVKNMLLWAQNMHSLDAEVPSETDGPSVLLQSSQLESKMNSKRIEQMCHQLSGLLGLVVQMQAIQGPAGAHIQNMLGMLSMVQPLVSGVAAAFRQLGLQFLTLHKAVAKLGYIVTSLLSGVMQEGFCTATESEESEAGEGAGTFKEHEGTGMGEGEGAKDVSDKIENEDQLQGAQQKGQEEQQDEKAEPKEQDESKGIEMEGDFEGSLHDMQADPDADDQEQEEEGEERMDQEMGDVGDEADVVDEQLWGQDEDKPQQSKAEEKYEKDAPVQVEDSSKLEYQAGQEEEAGDSKDKPKPEAQKQKEQQQQNADRDNDKGDEGEEEGGVNEDIQDKYEDSNFAPPTAPDQELELPEDMNLDDDGKAEEEEGGEDPAGADQHQDDQQQQQQQSGFQDQPDNKDPEPQDTENPAIDQDTNMEDDNDEEDGTEAAAAAAAAAEEEQGTDEQQPDQNMEGDEFNEGGDGEDDPMEGPLGGHEADEAEEQKQQPEAGPEGVAAPTAASTPAQAAGTSEGDKDVAEASVQSMPDQAQGPQQAQQGMQEGPQAPPQGQQSSFGMAEAGAGGAPTPSSGHDGGQQQSDSAEQKGSNPYRSLGDALQQWRSRLAVTGDSATPQQDTSEDAGIDNAPDAPPDQPPDAGQGEYEYMAEGDGLPNEDMVLAEGGLNDESAQQLRREVELRVKAASDGTLVLDTSQQSIAYGQEVWGRCEALTAGLSSDLAEQLRLVLEPQLASKMAGEYRTGKRISMKRVIAYIASHFRKDKIWLRRTRPDKRKFQVVVAVDDSRSMGENGCGSFALEALTLICRAMARLEVGEMGVVSYGGSNSILPLHPLEKPFTDANGPGIMAQMKFDQDNTIADNPMVELLTSMQHMLEQARVRSVGVGGSQDLHQLVIIVADGRFHEKESLQRVVAEASSKKGVLYAFIVLDNPASSLLDMQTVSFANGKPVFNKFRRGSLFAGGSSLASTDH